MYLRCPRILKDKKGASHPLNWSSDGVDMSFSSQMNTSSLSNGSDIRPRNTSFTFTARTWCSWMTSLNRDGSLRPWCSAADQEDPSSDPVLPVPWMVRKGLWLLPEEPLEIAWPDVFWESQHCGCTQGSWLREVLASAAQPVWCKTSDLFHQFMTHPGRRGRGCCLYSGTQIGTWYSPSLNFDMRCSSGVTGVCVFCCDEGNLPPTFYLQLFPFR